MSRIKDFFSHSITRLLAAITLGILTGVILAPVLGEARHAAINNYINPVLNVFVIIITRLAMIIIFFSITGSLAGTGENEKAGRRGRRTVLTFVLILVMAAATGAFAGYIVFDLGSAVTAAPYVSAASLDMSMEKALTDASLGDFLLGALPLNPVRAFIEGNSLQILTLSLIVGIIIRIFRKHMHRVVEIIKKVNGFLLRVLRVFGYIVPFYVLLCVVRAIWENSLSQYADIWKLALFFVIAMLVISAAITVAAAIKLKKSVIKVIRTVSASFLIAITTSTSMLAYDEMLKACKDHFGVPEDEANFAVPMGLMLCKPAASFYLAAICCYFAQVYGLQVSAVWLLTAALLASVMSITVAPVPAAGLGCYAVMFSQLGIPGAALALALSADSFMEFAITGVNVYNQPLAIAIAIGKNDKRKLIKT